MDRPLSTLELVVQLAASATRGAAAPALARRFGAERFLLFVRDPELPVMIPAPGFPQTLAGNSAWRSFVAGCTRPGRYEADVELPAGSPRRALAIAHDQLAAILVGDDSVRGELPILETVMPMLAAVLRAEQQAAFAIAEATEARRAASRAHEVSAALEAARAEGARLNAQLQEEHRRKDDFLAMLAHELRNPLMPLVMSIDLLRRAPDARAAARHLDIMARQTGQMSRLVEDLLDVSRVSRGRIELRRHRILLNDVLRDAVEATRPTVQLRRHELKLSMADEELPVNGDGVRLTQVFSNLLHNAAKYTDPNGRIEVATFRDGEYAVARVRDNGIGMAPEMLPRVFDLFAQAPVSLDRSQGGLGIGLTLVRALIELHGGEVVADSEGLGRGSVFTVRLPIMKSAAPRADPAPAQPPVQESERSLRVLVVDDNEDAANTLADVLRLTGHHAEVALSAAKALQAATDLDVDLVLLDIGLPDMDGFEVARRLRRILRRSSRLVAVTGYGTAEDRRRALEAGFDEHVVKPVMSETLAAVIHRAQGTIAAARIESVVDASIASDRNVA